MPLLGENKITPQQFKKKAEEYVKSCIENKSIPFLTGLANYCGISKDTLTRYKDKPSYSDVIKRIDALSEEMIWNKGLNENKPVFPIFLLKSKFGYSETQKIDLTSNGQTLGVIQVPTKKS